jgi:hypothetical protein
MNLSSRGVKRLTRSPSHRILRSRPICCAMHRHRAWSRGNRGDGLRRSPRRPKVSSDKRAPHKVGFLLLGRHRANAVEEIRRDGLLACNPRWQIDRPGRQGRARTRSRPCGPSAIPDGGRTDLPSLRAGNSPVMARWGIAHGYPTRFAPKTHAATDTTSSSMARRSCRVCARHRVAASRGRVAQRQCERASTRARNRRPKIGDPRFDESVVADRRGGQALGSALSPVHEPTERVHIVQCFHLRFFEVSF